VTLQAVETGLPALFGGNMFNGRETDYQKKTIINDGFWPDLELSDFQKQRSLPPDIDAGTQLQALLVATTEVNRQLQSVADRHMASGLKKAADVPGVHCQDGDNALVAQYRVAVYSCAKAELLSEFSALGRRTALPGAESSETRYGLLTESAQAVRSILGLGRATVSLL